MWVPQQHVCQYRQPLLAGFLMSCGGMPFVSLEGPAIFMPTRPCSPRLSCPCADRAHRIGQANSVNVYFLHATGSSDDLIWWV